MLCSWSIPAKRLLLLCFLSCPCTDRLVVSFSVDVRCRLADSFVSRIRSIRGFVHIVFPPRSSVSLCPASIFMFIPAIMSLPQQYNRPSTVCPSFSSMSLLQQYVHPSALCPPSNHVSFLSLQLVVFVLIRCVWAAPYPAFPLALLDH